MKITDIKPKPPSVIFLDIDGVLNCLSTAIAFKHGYENEYWSPVSVGLLRDLCERANCFIVIMSSKRKRFESDAALIAHFKELLQNTYKWTDAPIIGRTSSLGSIKNKLTQAHETRGYEIEAWYKTHGSIVEYSQNYVILDDDSDYLPYQFERLVKTTFANGLDLVAYSQCLNILGYKNKDIDIHAQNAISKYRALS